MTTFREYREQMDAGMEPDHTLPILPSDAVAFQGERAGFVTRAVAASIDVAIIFIVVLLTIVVLWALSFIFEPIGPSVPTVPEGERLPSAASMIVWGYFLNVAYWTIGWATGGRTIGNLVMGVRVVNRKGDKVRWSGAFVRALFCTVFPFGLLWVIVSGANRSVQDLVLRTNVIYDWVIGIPGLSRKAGLPKATDH